MSEKADEANVFMVPDTASTSAGALFFAQHFDDLTWSANQSILVKEIEELAEMIVEAVGKSRESQIWGSEIFLSAGLTGANEAISWAQRHFKSKAEYAKRLIQSNAQTSAEAVLCRYVDNFTCYISDLLRLLFAQYPKSLVESDATVSVKDVLGYSNFDSLLASLAERTINDLSFKGFGEIEAYYTKRFGFSLIPDPSLRQSVTFAIAVRNLLVHRRGIIDSRFVSMTNAGNHRVGYRIDVGERIWHEFVPAILCSVRDIDARAAIKFDLQPAFVLVPDKGGQMLNYSRLFDRDSND
jgi:hypothetical protein